jgi:hypothetical protein
VLKFYGRKKGDYRRLGFDINRNRMPEDDCLHPTNQMEEHFYYKKPELLFSEGTEVISPPSWFEPSKLEVANTPTGLLILQGISGNGWMSGHWVLLDKKLNSLLPSDFCIPWAEYPPEDLEDIGFIPVFQKKSNEI